MYKKIFKRIFDILISLIILFLLSPLYILTIVVLFFSNKGKPFFTQERVGKKNKVFKLIKFKSMNDKKDKKGNLLKDTDRLTAFGKLIRKYSIDELPQVINILKGDMSLIGPRPLLIQYLPYYSEYHAKRHDILPGITGLAQIKGRNDLKFSERFNLDVEYVKTVSFILDFKILWQTFFKFFNSKDIKIGRPISEIDDIGISKGLKRNLLNIKENEN